jgi:phosphoribosylamine-glycine ligase
MRLGLEGHKVICCVLEKSNKKVFDNIVKKVDNWKDYLKWCDYAVTDINDMVDVQKVMFERRVPCFNVSYSGKQYNIGGHKFKSWEFSNVLEGDRKMAHHIMKVLKMGTLPETCEFSDLEKAKKYLEQNEGPFVVKPESKGYIGSSLTYLGEFEDNADSIAHLESLQYRPEIKHINKVFIEKRIKGIEVAVSAWFTNKAFIYPVNVNFEHKMFGTGNVGWLTGEMATGMKYFGGKPKLFTETLEKIGPLLADLDFRGQIDINCIANEDGIFPLEFTPRCFDESTEMLTKDGWKNYKDIKIGDYALSINPKDKSVDWKPVINKMVFDHDGDMVNICGEGKHTTIDVLVTPEHKMVVSRKGVNELVRADSITSGSKILRCGNWIGEDREFVVIPEYIENHWLGRYNKEFKIIHPEVKIPTSIFVKFMGLYLAEGSMGKKGYTIQISQSIKGSRRGEIEKILNGLGVKYIIQKEGDYQINSVQFVAYMKLLGLFGEKCDNKHIPKEFKNLTPALLEDMLYGFALGDGSWHKKNNQMSVFTTSKVLAGDLQEIVHKIGYVANCVEYKTKGTPMSVNGGKVYYRNHNIFTLSIRKVKTDAYVDKRNTKTTKYVGKVWDVTVSDWHTLFVRRNGKAFFSGNCGYPAIHIEQELHITPWGEFIGAIATGSRVNLHVRPDWALGVVCVGEGFPSDDEGQKRMKYRPILGIDNDTIDHVHLCEVVVKDKKFMTDGAYVCVVTSHGKDIGEAQDKIYNGLLKKVHFPTMYYRIDGGDKIPGQYEQLKAWGYLE